MKYLAIFVVLTVVMASAAEPQEDKEPTPEEIARREKIVAEFGDFGKEYASASSYKAYTLTQLKVSKKELKNKKVQFDGAFLQFNDNFPKFMEDAGYSSKKYYYLIVGNAQLPVLARRNSKVAELLGKLKRGYTLRIYGRVKEFKSKGRGLAPEYYIEFASAMVLSTEIKDEANKNDKGGRRGKGDRPNRRWKR